MKNQKEKFCYNYKKLKPIKEFRSAGYTRKGTKTFKAKCKKCEGFSSIRGRPPKKYMRLKKDLSKGEIAEIKELYDGSYSSVRELSHLFNTSIIVMRYLLDYKNFRKKMRRHADKWQKENPERNREMVKKAVKKYQKKNREKILRKCREYHHLKKNPLKWRLRKYEPTKYKKK